MSNNKIRNIRREATMRNFSTYEFERYIFIDDSTTDEDEKNKFVKEINERLWLAIQETNSYAKGRLLPFLNVRRVVKDKTKLRIIINDFDCKKGLSDYEEMREISIDDLTHLINFKTLSPQRRVMVSDSIIPGNSKIIIDKKDQISAAVDIFLDISMFNSISFLNNMDLQSKKRFSKQKLDFYNNTKSTDDNLYYFIDEKKPPAYFSFAFASRLDSKSIDYSKYVTTWDRFLKEKYAGEQLKNISPPNQLDFHRDKKNLDKKYFDLDYWKDKSGDYLLLRINKEPGSSDREQAFATYFGNDDIHVGITKIVPISEYFNKFLRKQIDELYISAFKVIC